MNRVRKLVAALLVCALSIVCALSFTACGGGKSEKARYDIVAEYLADGSLSVDESVVVPIASDGTMQIKFNLYPNAYREGAKITPLKDGDTAGAFSLTEVKLNGKAADHKIEGSDENVLSVLLDREYKKGETVEVSIKYSAKLSVSDERLSFGAGRANLGNFFPMLCAFKDGNYIECEFGSVGDPFVSETADFSVSLTVPSDYVVASGFEAQSCDVEDTKTMYRYSAKNVRDVAFCINDNFSVVEKKWGDKSIKYYFYIDDEPEKTMEVAILALDYFSDNFGEYPYSSFTFAQTQFDAGGMEYPCFAMIADNLVKDDRLFAVVHEIAHQWWYGLVGNDQIGSPFLDESLAEYSTLAFFADHEDLGLDAEKIYNETKSGCAYAEHAFSSVYPDYVGAVGRGVKEYKGEFDYVNSVYSKGMLMMKAAEDAIGRKTLFKRLKKYCAKNAHSIAKREDLLKELGGARPIVESYLDGKIFLPLNP